MDDIVKQALAKWPNVPDCYGWLGLDARGHWYLRDEAAQRAGDFVHSRGSRLEHDKLIAFIARNYEADARGCWFFQNGPQRVYVELEAAPLVWRLQAGAEDAVQVQSHTGAEAQVERCLLDEQGRLFLVCGGVPGLVHSLDMGLAAQQVEAGHWRPQEVLAADLPARYGFVPSPLALAGTAPG